ncbi:MAG TPA: hypothetical protein VIM30_17330, partial [Candidatus Limnocylindrales bacterium]
RYHPANACRYEAASRNGRCRSGGVRGSNGFGCRAAEAADDQGDPFDRGRQRARTRAGRQRA